MKILLAYIPVWHAGYLHLFESVVDQIDTALVIDSQWAQSLSPKLEYLRKDIRSLTIQSTQQLLTKLFPDISIQVMSQNAQALSFARNHPIIVAPHEDVSQTVIEMFFKKSKIEYSPIFLRWDKHSATQQVVPSVSQIQGGEIFAKTILQLTYSEAGKSSDWWRHVGAALIRDTQPLLLAYNTQLPHPQESYIVGDARSLFHKGEWIDLTSAIHAEAGIIAQAAKQGIVTAGCDLLATTFPCPPCAKLIAQSGIRKLYFCEGYAMFDGEAILQSAGVEIIKVAIDPKTQASQDSASQVLIYPES